MRLWQRPRQTSFEHAELGQFTPQTVLITVFLHRPSAESNVKGFAHLEIQQRQLLFFKVLRAWRGHSVRVEGT